MNATYLWSKAVNDGWVDLQELSSVLPSCARPSCGMADCYGWVRFVDPSGVAWCAAHKASGLHGAPPEPDVHDDEFPF